MAQFAGQLWKVVQVLLDEVTANLDPGVDALGDGATGVLETHRGGVLGGPALDTGQGYRLVLEDGREWPIRLVHVRASDSAGIARLAFRVG